MATDFHGTTALVTGASSGIGAVVAERLAARGADLVLVARRTDRLTDLAARLRRDHGVSAETVAADLAAPDGPRRVVDAVHERGLRVGTLVNNAGFGAHGDVADADPGRLDDMVTLNVNAVVTLTRGLLPDLLAVGRGAVVNVASIAALQPLPHMATYGATKAFVLSFTEALSAELRGTGVHALALCPGATRTEFFEVMGSESPAVGRFQTPEQVGDTLFAALDRRRPPAMVVSGSTNRFLGSATHLLPRRAVLAVSARMMAA
ncbi:SDR family oxidoreductase [Isoptericola sp. BMS4]|uniref:SDR family NAD(P)-dependent oxidoreductase n=1 Tax=Isoptericola sp. BMS4 TaxID=2527875 RepID=UPI00141E9957|nr:SDR family oxidoreductase [Isoptericola sp. BMS4]